MALLGSSELAAPVVVAFYFFFSALIKSDLAALG